MDKSSITLYGRLRLEGAQSGNYEPAFPRSRHTFGTRAVDNVASIAAVQKVLGHKSIETTMQYVHATDEGKRRAVEAVEKTLKPGASGFPLTMRRQNEKWRWCDLLNFLILWWPLEDSNLQPKDYESSALPLS